MAKIKTEQQEKAPAKKKAGKPKINPPDDVEAIQRKINTYFEKCEKSEDKPTFCGLALALGYSALQSLRNNAKENTPISLPIKKAMLRIEEVYERGLFTGTPTGFIFALKNRGWIDKPEAAEGAMDNRLTIDFTE